MVAGVLMSASLAMVAHAGTPADAFSQHNDFTPQPNQMGPQPPHRALQWDARTGRWGLSFDVAQSVDHDPRPSDARLGAYYRVAPNLRVGPSVMLGPEETPDGRHLDSQEPQPRVRLETSFKF